MTKVSNKKHSKLFTSHNKLFAKHKKALEQMDAAWAENMNPNELFALWKTRSVDIVGPQYWVTLRTVFSICLSPERQAVFLEQFKSSKKGVEAIMNQEEHEAVEKLDALVPVYGWRRPGEYLAGLMWVLDPHFVEQIIEQIGGELVSVMLPKESVFAVFNNPTGQFLITIDEEWLAMVTEQFK